MAKRFTDTEKYKKKFIRNLPAPYKIFWDYLYHDCSFAGIWHVDFEVAQLRVGKDAPINKEEALRLFNEDEERIVVLNHGSKWLIKPFIDFQYGELNPLNRVHRAVLEELAKNGIKGLAKPLQRAKDKDKEKDKDKDKDIPPDFEAVNRYCQERGRKVDPVQWFNFYASKGWFIGKTKMVDWKAAVRTWENREQKQAVNQGQSQVSKNPKPKKDCSVCGGTGRIKENNAQCFCVV